MTALAAVLGLVPLAVYTASNLEQGATLEVLPLVMSRLAGARVLVLASLRPTDIGTGGPPSFSRSAATCCAWPSSLVTSVLT